MYMYLFLAHVVATALSARVPTHPLVSSVLHHSMMPSTHSHATEHAEDGKDIIWDALVRAARREKLLDMPGVDLDWLHRRFLCTQLNVGTRTWKRFKRRYAEQIELDDTQQWVRRRPQP